MFNSKLTWLHGPLSQCSIEPSTLSLETFPILEMELRVVNKVVEAKPSRSFLWWLFMETQLLCCLTFLSRKRWAREEAGGCLSHDPAALGCDMRSFSSASHYYLLLFIRSVLSGSFRPHELQHARLPCPSLYSRVCSNSCLLSQWCHQTILFPVTPLSSCPQSVPASGSFPMSWLFTLGGQSIGALASASVLLMNVQCWFPLGLTGLISLLSKGLSRVFSSTTVWRHRFFGAQSFLLSSSYIHTWLTGKTTASTRWTK